MRVDPEWGKNISQDYPIYQQKQDLRIPTQKPVKIGQTYRQGFDKCLMSSGLCLSEAA